MNTREVDENMGTVALPEDVYLLASLSARASGQPVAEWVADIIRDGATSLALADPEDDEREDVRHSPSAHSGDKTAAMFEIFRSYIAGTGPAQLNGSELGRMAGATGSYGRRCFAVWSKLYKQGVALDVIGMYPAPGAPLKACGCDTREDHLPRRLAQ